MKLVQRARFSSLTAAYAFRDALPPFVTHTMVRRCGHRLQGWEVSYLTIPM